MSGDAVMRTNVSATELLLHYPVCRWLVSQSLHIQNSITRFNLLVTFIFTAGRAMGAVHRRSLCMKHFRQSVCLVAVVEWSDVALWPEVCPDVMVYAAIRDTDLLFDFVCAEVFSEIGEDGVWRV